MLIEINEKEKTALSLLVGLRLKFSKSKKESYSGKELITILSESIAKINNDELDIIKEEIKKLFEPVIKMNLSGEVKERIAPRDEIWGVIDEQVERSKIRRFNWKGVFEKSLTQEILKLKKKGLSVEETFKSLCNDDRVKKFIEQNKFEEDKIIENIKISVHARYGENNTAKKVMEGKE